MQLQTNVLNASAGEEFSSGHTDKPARRRWTAQRIIGATSFATIIVCMIILVRLLPVDRAVQALQSTVDELGVLGPLVFGTAYIVAGLAFVPGAALTLAAGALFGLWWGTLIVSIASTITAALAFLIARYFARDSVRRAAQASPRFAAIDRAIGAGGWRIVALLRLSPVVPYSLGNYLYGLTSIRFWPYVLASWICMLPGTFMYVYIGHLGAQGLQAAGGAGAVNLGKTSLLIAGLIATVVVTVYITRLARRALAEQGAFDAPASDESAPPESAATRRGARAWMLPAIAIVMVGATAAACMHPERLQALFGPPSAALEEAYADDADGAAFDHSAFDALLHRYVAEGGWVDYEGLKTQTAALDAYIAALADAPFDELSRDEKLALLINAYNAFTLRLILENYPLKSIKDIPAPKRWSAKRWKVAGHVWSLNQIEHEQIRPKFREPRVHFALVCAAIGCPPLRSEAYVGARLDEQLADQTHYVHTHPRWFQFEPGGRIVRLTKLYDWYAADFKKVAGSVLEYAARHAPSLRAALDAGTKPKIRWLDYDWRLNSQENRP